MTIKELNILVSQFDDISSERKSLLDSLCVFIQDKKKHNEWINLIFICTHNSRRSQFAQVWAQVAAYYYQVPNVYCYSGGTEVTAMFPKVVETLVDSGFIAQQLSENENPVYSLKYDNNRPSIICFSKKYDHPFNPQTNFAAIMTCTHAEENCPFIPAAEKRISLPYNDPKEFDETSQQKIKYEACSLEIAKEMFYVFSKI